MQKFGWANTGQCCFWVGLCGVKSLSGGGSDLCVVQEGGYTSCWHNSAINRSYVHPKTQGKLWGWTKTGHKVSFCYYLSLSHTHTITHKYTKAFGPALLHSLFVHLFLFAQQEMYALPRSINKHGHTHAHKQRRRRTHTHALQNKQTRSHCK